MILVTGFGPFGAIRENPSGALARAVHGARVGGHTLVGLELSVTYGRGLEGALSAALAADCAAVIGTGIASDRECLEVERYSHNRLGETPDVDGWTPPVVEVNGPARVRATADIESLAAALAAGISEDAGSYVCNAWLYRMVRGLPGIPVAFVHMPPSGLAAGLFTDRLGRWLASI